MIVLNPQSSALLSAFVRGLMLMVFAVIHRTVPLVRLRSPFCKKERISCFNPPPYIIFGDSPIQRSCAAFAVVGYRIIGYIYGRKHKTKEIR